MKMRPADMGDMDALLIAAKTFITESTWDTTIDEGAAVEHFKLYLAYDHMDILICEDDGVLMGGVLVASSKEFQVDPFGYVSKFFIMPNARGSAASKRVMGAMLEWFRYKGVSHIFATATAGLTERDQRAFILMMRRSGFEETGPVMVMDMKG